MRKESGFTLIELLVVIAIIALLLAILMPSLQRVKKQANSVACQSNIKQWSYCWHMYLDESDGKFPTGAGASGDWPEMLRPYYHDRGALTLCPSAKKPYTEGGKVPFGAWRWQTEGGGWTDFEDKAGADYGSYGMNEWLGDRDDERCWRHREQKTSKKHTIVSGLCRLGYLAQRHAGPASVRWRCRAAERDAPDLSEQARRHRQRRFPGPQRKEGRPEGALDVQLESRVRYSRSLDQSRRGLDRRLARVDEKLERLLEID